MSEVIVRDRIVKTKKKEIVSANIIEVETGTNGYCGGDTGHGSRTYIRITDLSSTDIKCHLLPNAGNGSLIIELGGDCELSTIIRALKFIVKTLKRQIEHKHYKDYLRSCRYNNDYQEYDSDPLTGDD